MHSLARSTSWSPILPSPAQYGERSFGWSEALFYPSAHLVRAEAVSSSSARGWGGEGSIPVPLPPPACPKSCVLRAILLAIEASSQRTRCVASQQKGSLARERRLEVSKDLPTSKCWCFRSWWRRDCWWPVTGVGSWKSFFNSITNEEVTPY
jgi:hypothetical protein